MGVNNYSFQKADGSSLLDEDRLVSVAAATVALKRAKHSDERTVVLNRAAGVTVTLPAARGTGDMYRLVVGTTVTSNSDKVQVASAADYIRGQAWLICSANAGFASANTGTVATESDTITLNGTTTGGIAGDEIVLQDVAKNVWQVQICATGSGTAATPFSAAV